MGNLLENIAKLNASTRDLVKFGVRWKSNRAQEYFYLDSFLSEVENFLFSVGATVFRRKACNADYERRFPTSGVR